MRTGGDGGRREDHLEGCSQSDCNESWCRDSLDAWNDVTPHVMQKLFIPSRLSVGLTSFFNFVKTRPRLQLKPLIGLQRSEERKEKKKCIFDSFESPSQSARLSNLVLSCVLSFQLTQRLHWYHPTWPPCSKWSEIAAAIRNNIYIYLYTGYFINLFWRFHQGNHQKFFYIFEQPVVCMLNQNSKILLNMWLLMLTFG